MPKIKAMEKKIKRLWDTFYELWSEVEDDEYLLMNYPHAQEVVEFIFNCESEYGGIEKLYLSYPLDKLEKGIKEVREYLKEKE